VYGYGVQRAAAVLPVASVVVTEAGV